VNIELNQRQADLLREILDHEYRDLKFEIADTDAHEFKRELRDREAVMLSILQLVGGPLPDAP
jgi:hypothetical protein